MSGWMQRLTAGAASARRSACSSSTRIVARLATGDRRALAWRRAEGRGRVFHDALGHPDAAWADGDSRLALVRAGLRWATGVSRSAAAPRTPRRAGG